MELGQRVIPDGATYVALTEIHREMIDLQQDLADIEQITNIQGMYFCYYNCLHFDRTVIVNYSMNYEM